MAIGSAAMLKRLERCLADPLIPPDMKLADDRLKVAQLTKLLNCVRKKDHEMIRKIHEKGYPKIIDFVHPENGENAIGLAASLNFEETMHLLLELGANPNVRGPDGKTAAMRASANAHVEAMIILVNADADMTLKDAMGMGVLHHAIGSGGRHAKCMELAVDHGADVNDISCTGVPVLLSACETAHYNEELCLLLLDKQANPSLLDQESGRTALMAAAASGARDVVWKILTTDPSTINHVVDKSEIHAVHEAARGGHLEILRMLAAYGADMNQQTNKHYTEAETPIHMAALLGIDPKGCTFMAQRGCKAKTKTREGYLAAQLAKALENKACAKACKKAEKLDKPKAKKPALWLLWLHDYCCYHAEEIFAKFQNADPEGTGLIPTKTFLSILEECGAPLPDDQEDGMKKFIESHTVNKQIDYYLFMQSKKYIPKKFQMIKYEVKPGKDRKGKASKKVIKPPFPVCTAPESLTKEQIVPEHIKFTDYNRFSRDRPPVHPIEDDSAWYLEKPEQTYAKFNWTVRRRDFDTMVRSLDERPELIAQIDELYKTPLIVAANMGDIELVEKLLQAGADVKKKDNFFWTALHHACHSGKENVVSLLLDNGANKGAPALSGSTPLVRAIESNSADIVKLLVEKKKVNIRTDNRAGKVPLELAAEFGDFYTFEPIRKKEASLPEDKNKKKKKTVQEKKKEKEKPAGPPKYTYKEVLPPIMLQRKPSVLDHTTTLLHTEKNLPESAVYKPMQAWTALKTTDELIAEREARRRQYGWQIDFDEDYRPPFLLNIHNKLEVIAKRDEKLEFLKRRKWKKPKKKKKKE